MQRPGPVLRQEGDAEKSSAAETRETGSHKRSGSDRNAADDPTISDQEYSRQKTWGWHDCRPRTAAALPCGRSARFQVPEQIRLFPLENRIKILQEGQKLHAGDKCRHFCIMGAVRQLMPDSALTDMISCRISAKGKRTGNT